MIWEGTIALLWNKMLRRYQTLMKETEIEEVLVAKTTIMENNTTNEVTDRKKVLFVMEVAPSKCIWSE